MSVEIPPEPGQPLPAGDRRALRASHQDRDRVVEILQVAAGDGRLSAEELDQRLEAALTARTYAELEVLTADLPVAGGLPVPVADASVTPRDLMRIECRSGTVDRTGHWVVPHRLQAKVRSGSVVLNLTEATIAVPVLEIDADVRSGSLKLITKPGIVVETDDISNRSGTVRVKAPSGDVPVRLRVVIRGDVRSGTITAGPPRRPRRSFWQWLRRAPRPPAPTYDW